jgi:hypothetical protein
MVITEKTYAPLLPLHCVRFGRSLTAFVCFVLPRTRPASHRTSPPSPKNYVPPNLSRMKNSASHQPRPNFIISAGRNLFSVILKIIAFINRWTRSQARSYNRYRIRAPAKNDGLTRLTLGRCRQCSASYIRSQARLGYMGYLV